MLESSIFNVLQILFPSVKKKIDLSNVSDQNLSWMSGPESVLDVWKSYLSDTLAASQLRR